MLQPRGVSVAGICLRRIGDTRLQQPSRPFFLHPSACFTPLSSSHHLRLFRNLKAGLNSMQFWRDMEKVNGSNKRLLEMLRTNGNLKSEKVEGVMKQLDRGLFVPELELLSGAAYSDRPVPIGYNATLSAPHMHAECLHLLEEHLQPGMHALDVGSGSGYLSAAFALMVGEKGRTLGVEHIPELVEQSKVNVERSDAAHLLGSGSLSFHAGDGRQGWPDLAPYNAIHVGAAAESIPQALIDQLKVGGRMVIPVGDIFQDLKVVDKKADGTIIEWTVTAVRYVPLTSVREQLRRPY